MVDDDLKNLFSGKIRLPAAGVESNLEKEDSMARPVCSEWAETLRSDQESPASLEPLLVDENEAATLLGISKRTMFDLEQRGILVAKRIGKRKLYSVARLRAFAEGDN